MTHVAFKSSSAPPPGRRLGEVAAARIRPQLHSLEDPSGPRPDSRRLSVTCLPATFAATLRRYSLQDPPLRLGPGPPLWPHRSLVLPIQVSGLENPLLFNPDRLTTSLPFSGQTLDQALQPRPATVALEPTSKLFFCRSRPQG